MSTFRRSLAKYPRCWAMSTGASPIVSSEPTFSARTDGVACAGALAGVLVGALHAARIRHKHAPSRAVVCTQGLYGQRLAPRRRPARGTRGKQRFDTLAGGWLAAGGRRREVNLLLAPVGFVQHAAQAHDADVGLRHVLPQA